MMTFATLIATCLAAASPTRSADARHSPADVAAAAQQVAVESFSKLRKIHLVRPDLIAYPLVIDFVC